MSDTYRMKISGSIFDTNGKYIDHFILTFSKSSEAQLMESFPLVVLDYLKKRDFDNQMLISTQVRYGNTIKLNNYEAKIENGELKLESFVKETILHTNGKLR